MPRLIYADTLERAVMFLGEDSICNDCAYEFVSLIDEQPTIEAEPVNNTPRLLTIEEVLSSGDELMWLEIKHACQQLLIPTSPFNDNRKEAFSICFQSGEVQATGLYGKQWRCWTQKPSDEQRMAAKW